MVAKSTTAPQAKEAPVTAHSHGSIGAAVFCLAGGFLGIASAAHSSPEALPQALAAIGPDQVQAWAAVIFDILNKLFAIVNVAIGLYHSAKLMQHRQKRSAICKPTLESLPEKHDA